jgi:hypothetical protein
MPLQILTPNVVHLGRVIRRIAGNPEATSDRRRFKEVAAARLRVTWAARFVYTMP